MPAARVGDMHVCPMVTPGTPPIPHVGGPILPPCMPTVITCGMPQARVTDMCTCIGPLDSIATGSPMVLVGGLMAARMFDSTLHGGVIMTGAPTVLIGTGAATMIKQGIGSLVKQAKKLIAENAKNIDPVAFKKAMIGASQKGAPFCEQCARAAAARQG
jgi:uncharacterized Zn-binding protein involved in type VI secretion